MSAKQQGSGPEEAPTTGHFGGLRQGVRSTAHSTFCRGTDTRSKRPAELVYIYDILLGLGEDEVRRQKQLLGLLDVRAHITDDSIKVKGVLREDLPFVLNLEAGDLH